MQRSAVSLLMVAAGLAALSPRASAQALTPRVPARIMEPIDESRLGVLRGNTHPLARSEFDHGTAPLDLPMEHMLLVLTRSAAQETALQTLLAQQQDKSSPQYHKWLTPQQAGREFGAADQDLQTITAWLQSHGFQVNRVSNGKTVIDFSGTAGQVENAFHTEIHKYVVNGAAHWANASDPKIPAALTPVVAGVATLHNFTKKSQITRSHPQIQFTHTPGSRPQYTISDGNYALAPADYATIYNINPLYQANINGTGTTIAVVARSNILVSDINSFRSMFNLPVNPPVVVLNGPDPGEVSGDEEEAVLDTSWSGATAPNATVDLVVSESTNSADGVDLSELYIVDNNLADVMTESYGDCEANYTQAEGDYYSSIAQQAALEGITYTVAAGDSGAEGCDDPNSEITASGPISVNILAATPYDIAVGGTEFNENGNYSAYWNSSNNLAGGSAISYIPEDVWNESCTVAQCGYANAGIWAGAGGVSTLFAKPAWQAGVSGIPNDGARDIPDVSLTAANHDFYLLCLDGSCTPDNYGNSYFSGVSGTSAPTPSFAGIMALVVQKAGSRQGQAAPVLYALAAKESLASCNASNTSGLPAGNCIFNDVTVGNDAVPGETDYGTSSADYQATVGYDLATGLGSVNATNLVNGWGGAPINSSPLHIYIDYPSSVQSTFIGVTTFMGWAIDNESGVGISSVQISIDGVPYGTAAVVSRPDVCVVFPTATGCPNVGWSIPVETTQLTDGAHTLDVTATSTLGDHLTISTSFTVANWSTADPMMVHIGTPNPNNGSFSGVVGFGGWAIDNTGAVKTVAISIDGVPRGNAIYGITRADVCAAYPGRAGCPNVGWSFSFDTRALADGAHTLGVTGFTETGENTTVTTSFTTSNLSGSPIMISIGQPNAHSGPFSGPATFGGWALDNNGAIVSVSASVDGIPYPGAVYGLRRNDVCAVYPGRANCPNVGWNFVLDTTTIANGTHTLEITAAASNGAQATASSSFNVANTSAGVPLKMSIDNPNPQNSTVTGFIQLGGWAIDPNGPITSIEISIDGAPRGNASYNVNRPDVCAAYSNPPGCPLVGWTFPLDTTLLPDGLHTLAVTGSSITGDQLTLAITFTVANWTTGNPMRISIGIPNSQSAAFSGTVGFGGWALSDIAAITNIAIQIDGVAFGNATYGLTRSDVCAIFPGRAGCPNVGWSFLLDTTRLANGTHTLDVIATSSGGQSSTATMAFTVSNSTTGPVIVDIGYPTPGLILTSQADIGGWAVDTTRGVGIASVQILVDGVFKGTAAFVNRPDVCALYPGVTGCPTVGWTYSLDTTVLANGAHTLDVTATSTIGQNATVSRPFSVFNPQ